jgi:cytochrome P450
MEKSPIFLGAVGNVNGQTGVSLALNADHARQRRALGYLFTNSALVQHEDLIRVHIDRLVSVLKRFADEKEPVDFSSWCKLLEQA